MDNQQLQHAYELITNPILRLLVYFLSAAVVALASAVIYLYRDRQTLAKEMTTVNMEVAKAHASIAAAIETHNEQLRELRDLTLNYITKKKL